MKPRFRRHSLRIWKLVLFISRIVHLQFCNRAFVVFRMDFGILGIAVAVEAVGRQNHGKQFRSEL